MIWAIDFDGTVVEQEGRAYEDVTTPLVFKPGARDGLLALKAAGATLILWSGRAAASLLWDKRLDVLVRSGLRKLPSNWEVRRDLHRQRFIQMVEFVHRELPGVFDGMDDGLGGKPPVDCFLDDKAMQLGNGGGRSYDWYDVGSLYGEPPAAPMQEDPALADGMTYQLLVAPYRGLPGVEVMELAQTAAGPLLALDNCLPEPAPLVMVVTGQHGEEQWGPLALRQHAAELFDYARHRGVRLRMYPCANPEGFDRNTRRNRKGQQPVNAFLEYEVEPGVWRGELPMENGESVDPISVRIAATMADETRALWLDFERLPTPWALLDLHEDSILPAGHAFAYVDGDVAPYVEVMRTSPVRPFANKQLQNSSWSAVKVRTDANGLVTDFYDGSVNDYFWRRGAQLSACLETSFQGAMGEAIAVNIAWVRGFIDAAARGESA